jgi:hypothetical protein
MLLTLGRWQASLSKECTVRRPLLVATLRQRICFAECAELGSIVAADMVSPALPPLGKHTTAPATTESVSVLPLSGMLPVCPKSASMLPISLSSAVGSSASMPTMASGKQVWIHLTKESRTTVWSKEAERPLRWVGCRPVLHGCRRRRGCSLASCCLAVPCDAREAWLHPSFLSISLS